MRVSVQFERSAHVEQAAEGNLGSGIATRARMIPQLLQGDQVSVDAETDRCRQSTQYRAVVCNEWNQTEAITAEGDD